MKKLFFILMALCLNVFGMTIFTSCVGKQEKDAASGDFKLNIHVVEGHEPVVKGYKVFLSKEVDGKLDRIDTIFIDGKDASYSVYLDNVYFAVIGTIFSDDSIGNYGTMFPCVPGETAELKVVDDQFYLSGTGLYEQWKKADELVRGPHIHRTESDFIIKDYLKRHGDEEGCAMYYIMRRVLINETMRDTISKETLKGMIPQSIFEGRMKKVIDHYMKI